jgi:ubiquinone/menaquinone biosynthesis C-methylase UbiE
MLAIAKAKIRSPKVQFIQADILQKWDFILTKYDLASFSLVLEHIEDLEQIFNKLAEVIAENGHVYIGELHPFKQYSGSKARYTTEAGEQVVPCFNHHLSDFVQAARKNGFNIVTIQEYFDDANRTNIPRILTLLFNR